MLTRLLSRNSIVRIGGVLVLILLYLYLYKILMHRITAFGCFDDCFNFMGGYFLLHNKELFSQIFYNHAPFMAHISAFIQAAAHPINLYQLVLQHRQVLLFFGLLCETLLLLRFGVVVLPFAAIYELTKFYLFGDRFLAEGFIVYPLVYLLGLCFAKIIKNRVFFYDYFAASLCLWFVVFTREPYILAALFLFGIVLWGKDHGNKKKLAAAFLVVLCAITLFSYNLSEFFFNVIYVNMTLVTPHTTSLLASVAQTFLFPLLIFFEGQWNFIRYVQIVLAVVFLLANVLLVMKGKWQLVLVVWITLGLANIRTVLPGEEYFATFHLLPWYALFIFSTVLMLWQSRQWNTLLFSIGIFFFSLIIFVTIFSPASYTHDKVNEQYELLTNYGNVLQVGNVIAALSHPSDTLFVDGSEDMIYFVAHRYSSYRYSWYTSRMPEYKKYTDARLAMFAKNPPDFYYGSCPKQKDPHFLLPDFVAKEYIRLYNEKNPSCVWVKKSKLPDISQKQWQKALEFLYVLRTNS